MEYYYGRQLEERLKLLERRAQAEEQSAVARMTEKHAQEMIALIAEKETLADQDLNRHQKKLRSELDAHDVASAKIKGNVKDKQAQLKQQLDDQLQQKASKQHVTSRLQSQQVAVASDDVEEDLRPAGRALDQSTQSSSESIDNTTSRVFNQVEVVGAVSAQDSLARIAATRTSTAHAAHARPNKLTSQVEDFPEHQPVLPSQLGMTSRVKSH